MIATIAATLVVAGGIAWQAPEPVQAEESTSLAASQADDAQSVDDDATRAAIARGCEFLLRVQNDDGSFGGVRNATFTSSFGNPVTYHCWQVGTTGVCAIALLEVGGEAARPAVDRALDYLVANAHLVRPAEWDLDNNWGLIYGLQALSRALLQGGLAAAREQVLRDAAGEMLGLLQRFQSARGGWGYYADPEAGWRPDWATSFTTAAGVLALLDARDAKVAVDERMLAAAIRAVSRARLRNGAYDYEVVAVPRHLALESINQVKGSLGRIQVCNYALSRAGVELPATAVGDGVEQFFRHHRFLDVARNKPIPHEAWYANAAYFYLFGHYYASHTIALLPQHERGRWFRELRRDVMKCQQDDGSMWDFWIAANTKAYGTAFGIMALGRSL